MATRIWQGTSTDVSATANWSGSTLPVTGDHVYFENSTQDATGALTTFATEVFASFNADMTFTGDLGTATAPFQCGASRVNLGYNWGSGTPAGSGRLNLRLMNTATTQASVVEVFDSASAATDSGLEPIRLITNNTASTLHVRKGAVGVAVSQAGETASLSAVNVSGANATVHVGPGVTLSSYKQTGGTGRVRCSASTMEAQGGTLEVIGDAVATNVVAGRAATVYLDSAHTSGTGSATITTLKVSGVADLTRSTRKRTITNVEVYSGFSLSLDTVDVTLTNGIDFVQCDVRDGSLRVGSNYTLTPSAI